MILLPVVFILAAIASCSQIISFMTRLLQKTGQQSVSAVRCPVFFQYILFTEQRRGEITLRSVGKDSDNSLALTQLGSQLQSSGHICA